MGSSWMKGIHSVFGALSVPIDSLSQMLRLLSSILLLCLSYSSLAKPVEPLFIESDIDPSIFSEHVAWYSLGKRDIPPFEVYQNIDAFKPLRGEPLLIKESPSIYWLYFALETEQEHSLVLELQETNIEVVTLFEVTQSREGKTEIVAKGTRGLRYQDFSSDALSAYHHFRIDLSSGTKGFLLRLFSEHDRLVDLRLWQESDYLQHGREKALQQGLLTGSSGFLVILAFILWLVVRSHYYLGFVIFGISSAFLQLIFSGFALVWLWPESPHWREQVELLGILGLGISCLSLLPMFAKRWQSWMKHLTWGLVGFGSFCLITTLFLSPEWRQYVLIGYALIIGLYGSVMPAICARKNQESLPVSFMLAWSIAFTSLCLELGQESPLLLFASHSHAVHALLLVAQALMFITILMRFLSLIKQQNDDNVREIQMLTAEKETLIRDRRIKENFLSLISQELRTPLIGVIGGMDLLKTTELTPKQRQHWDMSHQSADQLHSLVTELLNFTEVQSGQISLKVEDVDFMELLSKLSRKYQHLCEQKGIEWSLSQDKGIPDRVRADSERITQLISHLLNNAVKFTFYGKIELRIRMPKKISVGDLVQLGFEVTDTGIGIPSDRIPYLFDPYALSEQMDRRQFGGLGLGLAYCQQLCELLNGQIEIESQSGQGTRVVAWVTLEKSDAAVGESGLSFSEAMLKSGESIQVLVVEDNLVNQIVLTGMLNKMNLTPHCADNGEQALEMLRGTTQEGATPFDIILMDCQMPIMDGFAATQAIRASGEYYCDLPIIAVTANATPEAKQHCLDVGMNDFMTKPFGLETLEHKLRPWISKRIESTPAFKNASGET